MKKRKTVPIADEITIIPQRTHKWMRWIVRRRRVVAIDSLAMVQVNT